MRPIWFGAGFIVGGALGVLVLWAITYYTCADPVWRPAWPALAVFVVTAAAWVALTLTWESPWWRQPLWFSDCWHVVSALTHWPAVLWMAWESYFGGWDCVWFTWRRWRTWGWLLATGLGAELVWVLIKAGAGKSWPVWWLAVWTWLREA